MIADTGDTIEEGQLLAEVDTSTLLLQQQAAQAGVERLLVHIATGERRVDRLNTLSARNLSSQTQLDDAREQLDVYRAEYKAAVAQLALVEDSLAKSRIIAPVSGVIQRRLITTGDFVSRGQPLFEITRPKQLQAWLPYPETVALRIQVGQPAKIYSPLTPGVFAEGEITDLQPTIGSGSRAVMAIVDLEDPGDLRPGATLSGKVLVETHQQAVLVPNISVVRRPAGELVYVISGNKAEARLVKTGQREGDLVEILSGLKGGETIATDGAAFLTDGASIELAESVKLNLPEISIKRHVFAYMLSAVMVLFGIISYRDIGVDRYPTVEFPMISVTTILPGATPEIIDASVTNLIESVVNSSPGIDHIQSNSSPGVSSINIRFNMEKDVNVAFNEVQARVNRILRDLPNEAEPPVVAKIEIGALPVMWLTLSGDRTLQQLNQYARNVIKKRLETIDGVGEIQLGGELRRTIRVNLDPVRMQQLGITVPDVVRMFNREHLRLPGGFLVNDNVETLVELDLEYHSPEQLGEMIVSYNGEAPQRLKDFAQIEDGLADFRELARFNGKPTVGIGILKVQDANTVAIVDEIKRRMNEELIPRLPPGIELGIAHDDGALTQGVVDSLEEHLVSGALLTALVVLLFLKNLRSTIIIAVAIPVSLLGAIAVMYFLGYTFNTMTMLGLLLLIGVVVDDAIVVLENIYRHAEEHGSGRMEAAASGTRQVVFAVMAATLTLVAIFAPVIFMKGIIGRFFEAFAVVVTFGVLASLFVSLTLTPMLCSRFLKVERKHGKLFHLIDRGFQAMDRTYVKLLHFSLGNRRLVAWVTLAVVISSGYFFSHTGSGFMPEQDEGRFIISVKAPMGASIHYTEAKIKEIEKILAGE